MTIQIVSFWLWMKWKVSTVFDNMSLASDWLTRNKIFLCRNTHYSVNHVTYKMIWNKFSTTEKMHFRLSPTKYQIFEFFFLESNWYSKNLLCNKHNCSTSILFAFSNTIINILPFPHPLGAVPHCFLYHFTSCVSIIL